MTKAEKLDSMIMNRLANKGEELRHITDEDRKEILAILESIANIAIEYARTYRRITEGLYE